MRKCEGMLEIVRIMIRNKKGYFLQIGKNGLIFAQLPVEIGLSEDFLKKSYFFFENVLDNRKLRWYNSDINNE